MPFTPADADRLGTAIASGKRKVTFGDGRSIEYHTLQEMVDARKSILAELAAAESQINPRRVTVARMRR